MYPWTIASIIMIALGNAILTSIDIHPLTPEPGLQQESLDLWSWSRRNLRYPYHIQKDFIASLHVSLSISHTSYLIFSQHCSPRWGYLYYAILHEPSPTLNIDLSTIPIVKTTFRRHTISQGRHYGYAVHIIVPTFGWVVEGFVANTISKLR